MRDKIKIFINADTSGDCAYCTLLHAIFITHNDRYVSQLIMTIDDGLHKPRDIGGFMLKIKLAVMYMFNRGVHRAPGGVQRGSHPPPATLSCRVLNFPSPRKPILKKKLPFDPPPWTDGKLRTPQVKDKKWHNSSKSLTYSLSNFLPNIKSAFGECKYLLGTPLEAWHLIGRGL